MTPLDRLYKRRARDIVASVKGDLDEALKIAIEDEMDPKWIEKEIKIYNKAIDIIRERQKTTAPGGPSYFKALTAVRQAPKNSLANYKKNLKLLLHAQTCPCEMHRAELA